VDKLVLATVNAPYRRSISGQTLAECLAAARPNGWTVHVATFFTDVTPRLVLEFAEGHGLSRSDLAQAYFAIKRETGQQNPALEAELGSLAISAS
jgi:hypothetical protein